MPAFSKKTSQILENKLHLMLSKRYPGKDSKDAAVKSIAQLNELTLLNSTHKYLKQNLLNRIKNSQLEPGNAHLNRLLQDLFCENRYTVTNKIIGLSEKENGTLAINALSIEQEIKKNAECSLEAYSHKDSLAIFPSQNRPIINKHLLSKLDIEAALLQLAKENPKQSTQFISCPVIALSALTEEEKKIGRLSDALKKIQHYPAHIILNTGNHWTRLFLNQEKDSKGKMKINAAYVNSNPDAGGGMVGSYQPFIEKTLKHAYEKKNVGAVTCIPTAHQKDNWSCGYHVLAGIATDAKIIHSLQTDQRTDYTKRTNALRNWVVKLVLGKTFNEHNQAVKQSSLDTSPLATHFLKTQVKPVINSNNASFSSDAKPQAERFPEARRTWIEENLIQEFDYNSEFIASKQHLLLTPKMSIEADKTLELVVSSNTVDVKHSTSLSDKNRATLAENMVKLFIANKLALKDCEKLPEKEDIKHRKLIIHSLTGNCKKLKKLIYTQLLNYGITLQPTPHKEKTSPCQTKVSADSQATDERIAQRALNMA